MGKNTLWKTNLVVCFIITIGFVVTSVIGYRSNTGIFKKDVEHVSTLAAEGIYYQIDKILSEPVNVSLAMANDTLLKTFLSRESARMDDRLYVQELGSYLNAYREKYTYDSVFLVSTATKRYYHFNGIDRVLTKGHPENEWYYSFLDADEEYALNIDNDEASDNSITVFVNCKIKGDAGQTVGVIGVGVRVNSLQALLRDYDERFHVKAELVDQSGILQLSSEQTGYDQINLFDDQAMEMQREKLLGANTEQQTFWNTDDGKTDFIVTQYVSDLKWHLIVENDMTVMDRQLKSQFIQGMLIIALILALVLLIITRVLGNYKKQIIKLSTSHRQGYQRLLEEVAEGLYDDIYEINATHNCAGSDDPKRYFSQFGITPATPFDQALRAVATKQVKEEFAQGYLDLFMPEHVLESYNNGITNLNYDFLATQDGGESYHWIRILARIFYWPSDESVRMISYRKNIDQQKQQELLLLEQSQIDALTGIYNKRTTEERITDALNQDKGADRQHALLVCDIDNFKNINDRYGHAFGDIVIAEFASELQSQFRGSDIVGRVGGDEFAVLALNYGNSGGLEEKLERFCARIANKDFGQEQGHIISCSLGVAFYPEQGELYNELYEKADHALYCAKAHGKGRFHIAGVDSEDGVAAHMNPRDIRELLETAADGIAKFACTDPLRILYFNPKLSALVGIKPQKLSDPGFDPMSTIHPDDLAAVQQTLAETMGRRGTGEAVFRLLRDDEEYIYVRLRAMFVSELYQNQYPIFYGAYTLLTGIVLNEDETREA